MRISEMISALDAIRREHGDLECRSDYSSGRIAAGRPVVLHLRITSKQDPNPGFWSHHLDAPEKRGDKVVRI